MALKKKAYEETEHMKEFEKACRERKIQENKAHLELNTKTILRRIQPTTTMTMKKNKKNHTTKTVKLSSLSVWLFFNFVGIVWEI